MSYECTAITQDDSIDVLKVERENAQQTKADT